jgi:hypothetical protein
LFSDARSAVHAPLRGTTKVAYTDISLRTANPCACRRGRNL